MKGRVKYQTSGRGWTIELCLVFVLGFLAATVLWLGLWFLETKPAQAAVVQEKESALEKCLAANNLCDQTKKEIQAQQEDLEKKLDDALAGWGRCIRQRQQAQGNEARKE